MKKTTLIIILSLLSFTNTFAQDLLDKVQDNSTLVKDLKDLYRAFHVHHAILEQQELLAISEEDGPSEIKKLTSDFIKECDSMKKIAFYNDTLKSFLTKYIQSTVQSYKVGQSKGFTSADFKKDYENYKKVKSKYFDYLYNRYSTSHFVHMSEDKYWKINDKNNYITSPRYEQYKKLKTTNIKSSLKLLDSIIKTTDNFQEYSVYQIESADQHEINNDSLEDASEVAISKYKEILDQNKYSIYLFEAWLKWRTVVQETEYGVSKTSDIPNSVYDKMREQVALTILKYIIANDNDEMAINGFLLMATHGIVQRFGDYPYGNQNTLEYHRLFDKKKTNE